VRATAPRDQRLIVIVEEEQFLQHRTGQRITVTAIPGCLIIGQELNRHAATT
jgi:hypothetical protein